MKFTSILKICMSITMLVLLIGCDSAKSSIAKLEARGYKVEWIDPEDLGQTDNAFLNVYTIADIEGDIIAVFFEFEEAEDMEIYFEDVSLDMSDFEDQIYKNVLIRGLENHEDVSHLMDIIKD
ncbi:hypothetical protein KHQ88_06625 [Mycoplasmatota bacterium]|nr:hypothetical protein KHQ88_06625 [Mycoplasmatota bacterium]